jgi:hypothetical protein
VRRAVIRLEAFREVALSDEESDTAKVEALNGIKLFEAADPRQHDSVAKNLVRILEDKQQNDLVRSYAAMAMRSYIVDAACLTALERIVRNLHEDLDLRYNAFDSIESNLVNPECRYVYSNLRDVSEFRDRVVERL